MNAQTHGVIKDEQADADARDDINKAVVLHYHLFKNAGTSLDSSFQECLAEGEWVTREFSGPSSKKSEELLEWICDHPEAKCFSSHTAPLPPPEIENLTILPVLFLRHPLDRIASAYAFESRQTISTFGSVLARNTSLSGYVETRLSIPTDNQCRNFHAVKLAEMYPESSDTVEDKADRALTELPFIGLVEEFVKSLEALQRCLDSTSLNGIELHVKRKNTSQSTKVTLDEKLDRLHAQLGSDLYSELEKVNSIDLKLYEALKKRYAN